MMPDSVASMIDEKQQERKVRIGRNAKLLDEAKSKVEKFCADFGLTIDGVHVEPDADRVMGTMAATMFVPCEYAHRKYLLFGPRGFCITFLAAIKQDGHAEFVTHAGRDGILYTACYQTERMEFIPEIIRRTMGSEINVIVNNLSSRYNSCLAAHSIDKENPPA
jgi:hypothetical protein